MIDSPACYDRGCIYYIGIGQPSGTELDERHVCRAFPNGIPDEIVTGRDLHLFVHPDQEGTLTFRKTLSNEEMERIKARTIYLLTGKTETTAQDMTNLMKYYKQREALGDSIEQINDELGIDPSKSSIVD